MSQINNHEEALATASRVFHELGGLATVIIVAADLLDTAAMTNEQHVGIDHIRATAYELDRRIKQASEEILSRLALTTGPVRVVPCLQGARIDSAVLEDEVTHLRKSHLIAEGSSVLIVAPGKLLAMLRRCFSQSFRLRLVTAPADVSFLLDDEPAQTIVLVPPPEEADMWLRSVRLMLLRFHFTPLLVHLTPIGDQTGA